MKGPLQIKVYTTSKEAREQMIPLLTLWPRREFEVIQANVLASKDGLMMECDQVFMIIMGAAFYAEAMCSNCGELVDPEQDATYIEASERWECNHCHTI